ncbi:MAG: radical SAM protein [Elusimicrobiota bacterium]
MDYKYIFGPVPSRRLGISLGIDIVPYKTCSYDCIYCECGKTTNRTINRKSYVNPEKIEKELKNFLKNKISTKQLDYITLSGGGEPTLNSKIGEIIDVIKIIAPDVNIALLTNGSLFYMKKVREDVKKCDLIVPSLDSALQKTFIKLNRPCCKLKIDKIIKGLKKLKTTNTKLWIEVFVVPGINDTEHEIRILKKVLTEIAPQKIQLNTMDRPGTEPDIKKAGLDKLKEIREYMKPLNTEIIGKVTSKATTEELSGDIESTILSILKRRPCTIEDISIISGKKKKIIEKYLRKLENSDRIISQNCRDSKEIKRGVFYKSNE